MEISALTRSVVKRNHAVISPDGYINSNVPGWTNCTVNVIINEQMGANLCQTLITAATGCELKGATKASQIFFYVVEGSAFVKIGSETKTLTKGQFVYIPIEQDYTFNGMPEGTQLLTFHKVYEKLEGYEVPKMFYLAMPQISKARYIWMMTPCAYKVLLPADLGFDMAVNIFTYQTGGNLPMVETHIMEHGLLYLQGQGVYMLDHEWYPIKKGDSIWMAPYCQQWFTAMGKEPAIYIYYKNVNRFPTVV